MIALQNEFNFMETWPVHLGLSSDSVAPALASQVACHHIQVKFLFVITSSWNIQTVKR